MASDFFERQDAARRGTTRLVVLFVLAVVAIVASVELMLAVALGLLGGDLDTNQVGHSAGANTGLFLLAAAGTLMVVGGGSLYRISQLRGGGRVVAEELGGRLVNGSTSDPVERRLVNVVEEMAIASGVPTPPVYMMDGEEGINAFAAGFAPQDAVIGVTRGAAEALDREQLQGVVAHEFSHILNGDMRLNIRLMGLLHGIFLIGIIGYVIMRMSFFTGGARSRDGKGGALPILALGAGLAVVGFAGTFLGNMIKAAVSRQREFLADASAVQFTRNPGGIAGALKKIGGFSSGSKVEHPNAPQASHMFLGRPTSGLSLMFSTHPPLAKRIRRLEPSWDGGFAEEPGSAAGEGLPPVPGAAGLAGGASAPSSAPPEALADAVGHVGQPTPEHVAHAARLLERLPGPVVAAAHEPHGACALICALLLDPEPAPRAVQRALMQAVAGDGLHEETLRLLPAVERLDRGLRLPAVEVALPALRSLTRAQHEQFRSLVVGLIEADETIDLFEWCLHRLLLRDMQAALGRAASRRTGRRSLDSVASPLVVVLSVLAYVGNREAEPAERAFGAGWRALSLPDRPRIPHEEVSFGALDAALNDLERAAPQATKRIVEAAVAVIAEDREVTVEESEVLRVVVASLGCPMPPVLPGQAAA